MMPEQVTTFALSLASEIQCYDYKIWKNLEKEMDTVFHQLSIGDLCRIEQANRIHKPLALSGDFSKKIQAKMWELAPNATLDELIQILQAFRYRSKP
jgi:hypothetical protein